MFGEVPEGQTRGEQRGAGPLLASLLLYSSPISVNAGSVSKRVGERASGRASRTVLTDVSLMLK